MFKNIIAPVQAWLLSQGRCVGCGNPLKKGSRVKISGEEGRITCKKCGRIFIYDRETKHYKRAPLSTSK